MTVMGDFSFGDLLANPQLSRALSDSLSDVKSEPAEVAKAQVLIEIVSNINEYWIPNSKAGPFTHITHASVRGSGPIIDLHIKPGTEVPIQEIVKNIEKVSKDLGFFLDGVVFQAVVGA